MHCVLLTKMELGGGKGEESGMERFAISSMAHEM